MARLIEFVSRIYVNVSRIYLANVTFFPVTLAVLLATVFWYLADRQQPHQLYSRQVLTTKALRPHFEFNTDKLIPEQSTSIQLMVY